MKKYLKWEETNFLWEQLDMQWQDVFIEIAEAVRKGGGGYGEYVGSGGNPWEKLRKDIGKEKTKKVIKLYCKVNGIDYEKSVESGTDIKVSVSEFERFVKEGISIKVNF